MAILVIKEKKVKVKSASALNIYIIFHVGFRVGLHATPFRKMKQGHVPQYCFVTSMYV